MKAPKVCPICGLDVSNGVGPAGLHIITKFLQVLPSSHLFYEPANYHDLEYHWGRTETDREKADLRFLMRMKEQIKNDCSWYLKPWFTLQAYRNYFFVREFGNEFFSYKGCNKRAKI